MPFCVTPLSTFCKITDACGTTAPLASFTVPVIVAVASCARAEEDITRNRNNYATVVLAVLIRSSYFEYLIVPPVLGLSIAFDLYQ